MGVKKTTKRFIEEAIKIHGDKYNYDLVNYVDNIEKVEIYCNTHKIIFLQRPSIHLRGSNCPHCANEDGTEKRRLTTDKFIEKAKEVHGDRYDYSSIRYTDCNSEVTITCKNHGNFQKTAKDFLYGVGCNECSKNKKDKIVLDSFVKKAKNKHGDKYCYLKTRYSNDKGSGKVTVVCNNHGEFEIIPSLHLSGQGCYKCGREAHRIALTKNSDKFIEECKIVHNNKYSYEKTKYTSTKDKVTVGCSNHGDFEQVSNDHLRGSGCPKCALLEKRGTYNKSGYVDRANGRVCIFYTLRCFNNEEEFYKIGITMNSVKMRYGGNTMPYEYEVISEIKGSAGFIWDLERDEKRKLKSLHYKPNLNFGGSETECFTDYKL